MVKKTTQLGLSTWQGMQSRDPRRLALGSAQWGMPYGITNQHGEPDASEIAAILARARRAGISTIETARSYGRAEARIGAEISPGDGWRVVTKLDADAHREGQGIGETLERVMRSLDESCKALATDALPVLMLHRFAHRHASGGKLWRALLAERETGRIGSLGVCTATPEEAWAALEDPDIEVLQVASSLLDLRLHRQGFFVRARELGRTIYVHSIFLQGVAHLDPRTLPPSLVDLSAPLQAIGSCAARIGVKPRALFLAFARELPGVHPVLGCETEAQLSELLADWSSEAVDAATMTQLTESLPILEAGVVDPTRWNTDEVAPRGQENQTRAASIATIGV